MGIGGLRADFLSWNDKRKCGRKDCGMHVSQPMTHRRVLGGRSFSLIYYLSFSFWSCLISFCCRINVFCWSLFAFCGCFKVFLYLLSRFLPTHIHNKLTVHCFFVSNCLKPSNSSKKQCTVTALPYFKKL
jgi:ABC-type transport system involved in multi-copper enzyme maturation permease subunit